MGKGKFLNGKEFFYRDSIIVPQEGINRCGIGKKNSRVKWGFYETDRVNSEEYGKVNHSGIEEKN